MKYEKNAPECSAGSQKKTKEPRRREGAKTAAKGMLLRASWNCVTNADFGMIVKRFVFLL